MTEEGVLKFWKGTVPRLGRLIVSIDRWRLEGPKLTSAQMSGGIIFTVYEKAYPIFDPLF
jgi:solute carrier family 25 citrate transporter 1